MLLNYYDLKKCLLLWNTLQFFYLMYKTLHVVSLSPPSTAFLCVFFLMFIHLQVFFFIFIFSSIHSEIHQNNVKCIIKKIHTSLWIRYQGLAHVHATKINTLCSEVDVSMIHSSLSSWWYSWSWWLKYCSQ